MGITIAETNGVVVNLIQQKLDGKILPSVFRDRNVSKNRFGIITKDMWYKIHPLPCFIRNCFYISETARTPAFIPNDRYDGNDG